MSLIIIARCLAVVQGGESQAEPRESLSCGYGAERQGKTKQLEFTSQSTRQRRGAEMEPWRSTEGPKSIMLNTIYTWM